jgi:hypothetical protein
VVKSGDTRERLWVEILRAAKTQKNSELWIFFRFYLYQIWEGVLPCAQPWHTANIAVCQDWLTVKLPRVTIIWPWVKVSFTVTGFAVCSSPWATHGKAFAMCGLGFAVCARHTANPPPHPLVSISRAVTRVGCPPCPVALHPVTVLGFWGPFGKFDAMAPIDHKNFILLLCKSHGWKYYSLLYYKRKHYWMVDRFDR